MLTEKDYCDYETCVALKELGYKGTTGECSHFGAFHMNGKEIFYDRLYNSELKENECLRVPLYLAQKWLREEKEIDVMVIRDYWCNTKYNPYCRHYYPKLYRKCGRFEKAEEVGDEPTYDSYEKALSEGIKEAVKILKGDETILR